MRPLVDIVTHKHELLGFDTDRPESWQPLEVKQGDRTYRVQVPIVYDNGVERIVRVDDCGALLYLFGEVGHDHRDEGRIGCLIAARPLEDGTYQAFLFHSLYPRTTMGVPRRGSE
jgi:hypothetical protein